MSRFPYQIGLMGKFELHEEQLRSTLRRRFEDLGFKTSDYRLLRGNEIFERERRAPFAAMYFGHDDAENDNPELLEDVLSDSAVVLPIVDDLPEFSSNVHSKLKHINGIQLDPSDTTFERDVGTVLENFRLLRRDRRLFISYKRDDARRVALQLYEALDDMRFDVFLDTRGVPPGEDFQSVLWHRLADSDVVILLDTPHFFESRWTKAEFTRANATSVQILHLLWPGRPPTDETGLSSFLALESNDFVGSEIGEDACLGESVVKKIAVEVESLRARALSVRHRFLVDAFCDNARRLGINVNVQPTRQVEFRGKEKEGVVMPLVGVPSAQRLHEIYRMLNEVHSVPSAIWALYDDTGLLNTTIDHLKWLNNNLPLKTASVHEISEVLQNEASA